MHHDAHTLFTFRYGEAHPMFFIGSLEAASQEAFYGKARDVSKLISCLEPYRNVYDFLGNCNGKQNPIFLALVMLQTLLILTL